jgi:hypothetical protein
MFHTYVLTASGTAVEFDRALPLMDQGLLQDSIAAMKYEQSTFPRWDANYGAQWIWEEYCERHCERFGEEFGPEIIPRWGLPPEPPFEPMSPSDVAAFTKDIVPLTRERMPQVLAQFRAKFGYSNPWPEFDELDDADRGALWMWGDY